VTVCVNAPVLVLTEWLPPANGVVRDDVMKVAVVTPRVVLSGPVPSVVVPFLKVTIPVGSPAPGAVTFTVAVNVTDWPKTEGAAEAVTEVVVAACFTVCVRLAPLLAWKLVAPA
jgi:hypothetical protein